MPALLSPEELTKIGHRLYGRRAWIARMAHDIGVDQSTVWRWAHAKRRIEPITNFSVRALLEKHKARRALGADRK